MRCFFMLIQLSNQIKIKMKHSLLVCTTCSSTWQDGKKVGVSGGEILLNALSEWHKDAVSDGASDILRSQIEIRAVECMSACSHACVVTFASEGKYSYVFGDLPINPENISTTINAIVSCAEIYRDRPDGTLAWKERPEPLRKGMIARIPPL
jgi:predicted metal-binding protein